MNLSLSASLLARGVTSWDDPAGRETALTEPCTWCRARIKTRIDDRDLVVVRGDYRGVVLDRLVDSRLGHFAADRCATAGHDPGDEDAEENARRIAWRLA